MPVHASFNLSSLLVIPGMWYNQREIVITSDTIIWNSLLSPKISWVPYHQNLWLGHLWGRAKPTELTLYVLKLTKHITKFTASLTHLSHKWRWFWVLYVPTFLIHKMTTLVCHWREGYNQEELDFGTYYHLLPHPHTLGHRYAIHKFISEAQSYRFQFQFRCVM